MAFQIRDATPDDASTIASLIQELADFEKMPDGPKISVETLSNDLKREAVFVKLAYDGDQNAGMMLYYNAYSSWEGQFIFMEDLYVKPAFRRRGLAAQFVKILAKEAHARGVTRINWNVLNWNTGARDFYHKILDAIDLSQEEGWLVYRLDGPRIKKLATES